MELKRNVIVTMTFEFAVSIVLLCRNLAKDRECVFRSQLLKCATSIGANVEEAIGAQSRKDFIAKMSIAKKEAREARYWLRLHDRTKIEPVNYSEYLNSIESIINILTKIIMTTESRGNNPKG